MKNSSNKIVDMVLIFVFLTFQGFNIRAGENFWDATTLRNAFFNVLKVKVNKTRSEGRKVDF